MPRNVRNFWLDARVPGRSTALEGGPVGKTDGFDQTIYMRRDGGVTVGARLRGWYGGGRLHLEIEPGDDVEVTPSQGRPGAVTLTTTR